MDFVQAEEREGARLTWNVWPSTRLEAHRVVVPLAAIVAPGKPLSEDQVLPYEPLQCRGCHLCLNPYCQVDFQGKTWSCPHCLARNQFPPHYHSISPEQLPAELFPQYTTVEYRLPKMGAQTRPLAIIFVLDACMAEEDLSAAKESIEQVMGVLPGDVCVGLVAFGRTVSLYEVSQSDGFTRSVLFKGDRDMSGDQVRSLLQLGSRPPSKNQQAHNPCDSFLRPHAECEYSLERILEELRPEHQRSRLQGHRPERAVGAALNVATTLLEMHSQGQGGRVVLLTSGPPTIGPGAIAETDYSNELRTHHDFEKGVAKHYKRARAHYDAIGQRLAASSAALDVFACSMDQCGLAEMKGAVESTGGVALLAESFSSEVYRRTLHHAFACDERSGSLRGFYNGSFTAHAPKEVRVNGAIGPLTPADNPKHSVCQPSDIEVGHGGTVCWRLPTLSEGTNVAVYFEVANAQANQLPTGSPLVLQFQCSYLTASGERRLRAATIARTWAEDSGGTVASAFDQEAAAVAVARRATHRAESEEAFDILRWLDRQLIRLCAKFGEYTTDVPASFTLGSNFGLYPQFMFNLRRSQFLQVFNNVPDETAYYRLMLCRENVANSLLMIQPSLISYSLDSPPEPVLLDIAAVQPDRILIFDTFFLVLIHYGSTVAYWRNQGYHNDPNYGAFKEMLDAPNQEATRTFKNRFPTPTFKEVDQGSSQARFLLAKLNPSATHENATSTFGYSGEYINTEDASFETFLNHLKRLAVAS